ncbi:MAG: hypothetical protein ABI624_21960 [Casimicrobiaceae bacterium]
MANRWHWLAVLAASASLTAGASTLTVEDCFEGSDFIAHAALARENGMSREAFLGRLEDDLLLIHAFPPALRWFAKDEDDEIFLTQAAREVFDAPDTPEGHRARFLAACFGRSNV